MYSGIGHLDICTIIQCVLDSFIYHITDLFFLSSFFVPLFDGRGVCIGKIWSNLPVPASHTSRAIKVTIVPCVPMYVQCGQRDSLYWCPVLPVPISPGLVVHQCHLSYIPAHHPAMSPVLCPSHQTPSTTETWYPSGPIWLWLTAQGRQCYVALNSVYGQGLIALYGSDIS